MGDLNLSSAPPRSPFVAKLHSGPSLTEKVRDFLMASKSIPLIGLSPLPRRHVRRPQAGRYHGAAGRSTEPAREAGVSPADPLIA